MGVPGSQRNYSTLADNPNVVVKPDLQQNKKFKLFQDPQKQQNFNETSGAILGAASGLGSSLLASAPVAYNRYNMPEYDEVKDIMGATTQGMSLGSMFGPFGALIGAGIGAGIGGIQSKSNKDAYNQIMAKLDLRQQLEKAQSKLAPDYTSTQIGGVGGQYASAYGMPVYNAKYGISAPGYVPAELEQDEVVVRKNPATGRYGIVLETDKNHPSHEQQEMTGKPMIYNLRENDLVFNGEQKKAVKKALMNNDYKAFEREKNKMFTKSIAAGLRDEEYSLGREGAMDMLDSLDTKETQMVLNKLQKQNFKFGGKTMKNNNMYSRYGVKMNDMRMGGKNLKQIPEGPKGARLRSLKQESPETVNQMGYMQYGGMPNNPYMPAMADANYNQQLFSDVMYPQMGMRQGGMAMEDEMMDNAQMPDEMEMDFNFSDLIDQMKYGAKMMEGGMAKMMKYGSKMGYGGKSKRK